MAAVETYIWGDTYITSTLRGRMGGEVGKAKMSKNEMFPDVVR